MGNGMEPWHLDRRLPIIGILMLLFQTGGLVWWGATITQQVERNTIVLGTHVDQHPDRVNGFDRRIVVLETQGVMQMREFEKINGKLDRLMERLMQDNADRNAGKPRSGS